VTSSGYVEDTFFTFQAHEEPRPSIVIVPDIPDTSEYESLLDWFHRHGFNAFYPRLPGSMQSHGSFLRANPTTWLQRVVKHLETGSIGDVYFESTSVSIVTSGLGAPIALGSQAVHESFNKVLAFNPVWDWDLLLRVGDSLQSRLEKNKYLYRDVPSDVHSHIKQFDSLYPHTYVPSVDTDLKVFHSDAATLPFAASEEMQEHIDLELTETKAKTLQQCILQNLSHVYRFVEDEARL
jgi:hypothetical protein